MSLVDVSKFFDENDTCVLATVSADGKPQAATVGFSHGQDFSIIIATNKNTLQSEPARPIRQGETFALKKLGSGQSKG